MLELARQALYIEVRPGKNCCREKVLSITYSECVCLLPVWLYNIFPHYLKHHTIFFEKKNHKICVLSFSATFVRTFFSL
jgi:hypothetical protein